MNTIMNKKQEIFYAFVAICVGTVYFTIFAMLFYSLALFAGISKHAQLVGVFGAIIGGYVYVYLIRPAFGEI